MYNSTGLVKKEPGDLKKPSSRIEEAASSFLGLLDHGSFRRVRGTLLDVFLFVFPSLMRPGDGLHQRFNLEAAIGREKAMPAINMQRKFL
jgi:hypothetical protein